MKVAIVGLGFVGGSLARDLARRGTTVLGFDRSEAVLRAARRSGVVTRALDATLAGVAGADVFVLAVPVTDAPRLLLAARPHLKNVGLITDVGSTKRSLVRAAERLGLGARFVGAHPLAGGHRSGWAASRAGLFHGAQVLLCPSFITVPESVERARAFWRSVGAEPALMEADEHDARMALLSHLPQVTSTLLAALLAEARIRREDLGPGGRDATRLAGSSPAMWTAIALDNAAHVTRAIAACERKLATVRRAIRRRDAAAVNAFFEAGNRWFGAD
jgi:prephenate dehydrogenase